MSKPRIWYLPTPSHTRNVFKEGTYQRFLGSFDVVENNTDRAVTAAEVEEGISAFDGLVTGWGVGPLSAAGLEQADRLKIIVHSAGSVKYLLTPEMVAGQLVPRQIRVVSANSAIALNVAEHTVGALIMMSRRWIHHAINIRERGMWRDPNHAGSNQYLRGAVVGIVSASKVGREVIRLLRPFNVRILVFDPYLSEWDAGRLNVERVDLNTLFKTCDMVSIHAPSILETDRMIGAGQLRLLRDDAVLVNTSRGSVLDHDALYEEAKSGRIQVQLDVTTPEPLPPDHRLRTLPNVVLTPHTSGTGAFGHLEIGEITVAALERFFSGQEPVPGEVDLSSWAHLA